MGPGRLLFPALLILGCAHSPPPQQQQQPVPLRATSGPVTRPKSITTPIDRDGDRVPDGSDRCPTQPGSLRDGCPVVDTDGDGISDRYDRCPTVPEVRDGRADGDGCPISAAGAR
ncbi:thrombospondin type 3 repeat-containing protein [Nannocystis sp.]|uniref:thrombospondin type 3 repeat-containing protein n=1 Tax=Nannocystis sp. TaxID=1962667 RepID=UPI0025F8D8FF|nr:thrombospondin type 3 repeat-containing protein [Nannocystis sp.]MBK7828541.1 thrombospondin type 3 repeat-containing protein [Nannocystis sp.]